MRYEQLTCEEALREYADWLLEQQTDTPAGRFFRIIDTNGVQSYEWYMIFYSLRTLMYAGQLLNEKKYLDAVVYYFDTYLSEQLPNGALSSNYRNQPTSSLSHEEFVRLMRTGKLNLADNGSNCQAVVQAAMSTGSEERKKRYLGAVKNWFDNWTVLFTLPNKAYGNGFWGGHKLEAPYSMAANVCSAFAAYGKATGDMEYQKYAEDFIMFLCDHWLDDGRPIRFNCYPVESNGVIDDYSRIFYLLEAMCWTHFGSTDDAVRARIEERVRQWLFGKYGILMMWKPWQSWFDVQGINQHRMPVPEGLYSSRTEVRNMWELAKSNGIPYLFSYVLRNILQDAELQKRLDSGLKYLSHPLKARMSGIVTEPEEDYGAFAVQATGFAGVSLAEGIRPGWTFDCCVKR